MSSGKWWPFCLSLNVLKFCEYHFQITAQSWSDFGQPRTGTDSLPLSQVTATHLKISTSKLIGAWSEMSCRDLTTWQDIRMLVVPAIAGWWHVPFWKLISVNNSRYLVQNLLSCVSILCSVCHQVYKLYFVPRWNYYGMLNFKVYKVLLFLPSFCLSIFVLAWFCCSLVGCSTLIDCCWVFQGKTTKRAKKEASSGEDEDFDEGSEPPSDNSGDEVSLADLATNMWNA